MTSHQMFSDQVLSMVVEQAIYPITTDVLYSLFAPFGVEQLVVYPQTKSEDGEPFVAADVRFTSAHAFAYWDGRCIYYRCCRLQMWCATLDVLPAPASTSPTVVKDNRDTAIDLTNSTAAISGHDGKSVGAIDIPAAASTSTPPHGHDTSPKSSLDSDCRVPVAGTDEYTLVAAIPEVVTELAIFPGVPSTTVCHDLAIDLNATTVVFPELTVIRNDKEVEQFPSHTVIEEDAAPGVIITDVFTRRFSLVTTVVYNDANKIVAPAAPILLTAEYPRSCLPDTPKLSLMAMAFQQVWWQWMRLRPTPWPSFWRDLADGNEAGGDQMHRYLVQQLESVEIIINFRTMPSTEASETCECQHLISTKVYHELWDCFEVGSGTRYPKSDEVCASVISIFEWGSFQKWVLGLYFNKMVMLNASVFFFLSSLPYVYGSSTWACTRWACFGTPEDRRCSCYWS
ncbi:uncharacterized protein LOC119353528 [Triticum dicoccoides]|uniref:uncharacterized protein LOC119353528 n=1 Tax=Triticum dicoccoides TaxID=85692 RepID=UPI00189005D2|nr:uncharacterized protein LOC119353528 [Triticum dicoccoides]